MDIQKMVEPAKDWSDASWIDRIDRCASFLFLHGYITQAQRSKVTEKLERQVTQGLASGAIVRKESPE